MRTYESLDTFSSRQVLRTLREPLSKTPGERWQVAFSRATKQWQVVNVAVVLHDPLRRDLWSRYLLSASAVHQSSRGFVSRMAPPDDAGGTPPRPCISRRCTATLPRRAEGKWYIADVSYFTHFKTQIYCFYRGFLVIVTQYSESFSGLFYLETDAVQGL